MFQAIVLACMVGSANCVMLLSNELDTPVGCLKFYEYTMPMLKALGAAAAAAGSAGITLQIITEYASLAVISLNLVLAIGGIYVLFLRSKAIKKSLK
jgi:predicted exporter